MWQNLDFGVLTPSEYKSIRTHAVTAPSPQHAATIKMSEAVSSVEAESCVDVSVRLFFYKIKHATL